MGSTMLLVGMESASSLTVVRIIASAQNVRDWPFVKMLNLTVTFIVLIIVLIKISIRIRPNTN